MIGKIKAILLSMSMVATLVFAAGAVLIPMPAQAAINCVPICDPGPCLCDSSGKPCVTWAAIGGGPCISPNPLPQCYDVCIGPST